MDYRSMLNAHIHMYIPALYGISSQAAVYYALPYTIALRFNTATDFCGVV